MNTFLPFPNFVQSAQALDYKRLGKQRIEALTMLRGGWKNHPASKMWRGYEYALAEYGIVVCKEWICRGYKDTRLDLFLEERNNLECTGLPPWFGREDFHLSHKSNLIRKLPEHYGPLFPGVPNDLPYIWPKV